MTKANKIEELPLEDLSAVMIKVLENGEYEDVSQKGDNILEGLIPSGLTTLRTGFYLYTNRLSGDQLELDELAENINLIATQFYFDKILVVCTHTISTATEKFLSQNCQISLDYIGRDTLSELIESNLPNFWTYKNLDLVAYERYYLDEMTENSSLTNIPGLEKKAARLLDIYVKPRIYEVTDDIEKQGVQLEKVNEKDVIEIQQSAVIEGDTGAGKSTFLKQMGRHYIEDTGSKVKTLPVFISTINIINSKYNIKKAAMKHLERTLASDWDEILVSYNITLLVDSIDEFEAKIRSEIVLQLNDLSSNPKIRFILGTRSIESNHFNSLCNNVKFYQIRKFNIQQIKEFATRFFNSADRAKELMDALTDNRILERLPLTPLSISLISLLYEKQNFEIPATISDIYDNFNQLILGKSSATKRFQLLTFNFRERILTIYALELIKTRDRLPYTKNEFINFFEIYFKNKSSGVAPEVIAEFLDFFIDNSGILIVEDGLYVKFSHNSFLEYYASLEIFKHKRELEKDLIQNFLNLNWQNVAIFYAGQSKDMPNFLNGIIGTMEKAEDLEEYTNSILGIGYLLQALYQTDNKIREKAVLTALDHSLIIHDWYKKLSTDGQLVFFKNLKLPVLSIFNMYFFYLNFLSITLKEPMQLAFDKLLADYKTTNDSNIGYKLLTIAAVFHSPRLKDSSLLEILIEKTALLKDPYLTTIAEYSLYFDRSDNHKELKKEIHKSFVRLNSVTKKLLSTPAKNLRFTHLDMIQADKKVKIITEGKTDAIILEHAYSVLTQGRIPYWQVRPAGIQDGGANEVRMVLQKAKPFEDETNMIIGIFDADTAGINAFNGLPKDKFVRYKDSLRIKQLEDSNIYGIKIPIPPSKLKYKSDDIEYNYFSIEHYFEESLLKESKMLVKTPIEKVFKINDSRKAKSDFATKIRNENKPDIFKHFIGLFETIDEICGVKQTDYYNFLS
ncbi:NACHT domain-containing protein [Mesoflavibacter zeaxanthinifaciens]|uniref:NACHT domain-containing protein n=1 Tax=Mesoflavibacter zeaxanthinifaciens TaxID=393060 RepID=UPI003A94F3D7